MKKILVFVITVTFALSTPVFAGETLSEDELDAISAGDWIVLNTEEDKEVVDGLYFNTNDIHLDPGSQQYIQAVSQANVVDSAVAVQTSIANVTGENGIANNNTEGHNIANIANYNASTFEKTWEKGSTSRSFSESVVENSVAKDFSWLSESKGSSFFFHESDVIDEDLVIAAALVAAGEKEGKNEEAEIVTAAAFALGYTYDEVYDKKGGGFSNGKTDVSKVWFEHDASTKHTGKSEASGTDRGSSRRSATPENNDFSLSKNPQTNIQAVSNLNAISAGAGIQSNMANNVGGGGSIIHSNTATVANGL